MTLQQTRMPSAVLWLGLASLAVTSWVHLADGAPAPLQVLSAPNLLRVGAEENVFVECQDCTADQRVQVKVMNHPSKSQLLTSQDVLLSAQNNYQGFGKITIPAGTFKKDPTLKQYVYLQAQFPDRLLEKVVLVSFQSGYIFIQTDKTIYTPNTVVHFRLFVVTPDMQPIERNDQAQIDTSLSIQFETPEGIVLPLDPVSPKSGIYTGDYKLPEVVSFGVWKVVASLHSNPQETFSAEFEVKEYVLPSFEVKLTSESEFFYVDTPELVLNIRATYLFGQEVQGTAYVVFGVIDEDRKKSFPSSLQRVPITQGVGQARLLGQHIIDAFPRIQDLVGKSLFASVSVLTESGSEMVEAEIKGILIVTSPYTINFKKTPKFYKPGMSLDVAVQVLNPDGSPAARVPVVVTPGDVTGPTTDNGIAKLTINTAMGTNPLVITARTKKEEIADGRQATAQMTARPYQSMARNYIHIGVDASELKLGDPLKINLNLQQSGELNHRITYLVQSKGRLTSYGSYLRQGQVIITLSETITKDMLPSFRIVAYYHVGTTEVVSDSIWVDVKDTCMGSLKLESGRAVPSYEPRKLFSLKVTGDPGATVGLVAVDKGVYVLNNKHRLTQTKVWDIVERYDTGCTPGGGANSMGVFYDAGLLLETSTASGTNSRIEPKCPVPARKRRAATITDVRTSLVSAYEDKLEKSCCVAGMTEVPVSYSCERRAEYVTEGPGCAAAFLHCCKHLEIAQLTEGSQGILHLARSDEDDSYMDSNEISSRTNFPESWLWSDIKLPDCPASNPRCVTTQLVKNIALQDSITTWQLTGISLSRNHGICVGETLEVIVRKEFFIDLRLPYSAVRGEQLEVKAILHNYSPDEITVRVDLIEQPDVCSSASKKGRHRQEVTVGPSSTRSVPYIIIPMKNGHHNIEVKGAVKDSSLNDGILKKLFVVPNGVLVKAPKNITLDPSKHHGRQVETVASKIPKKDIVPNTPATTQVSITGGQQMGALVEKAVTGTSMGSLIKQPGGCGEQNMILMTLPVIATLYLDKTTQWEKVGFAKRDEGLKHIKTGYQNELVFRKADGAFAVWTNRNPSSWLTAYVAKVFAMASSLVAVDINHLCGAIKWLILNSQQPDGLFKEVGTVAHGEMIGNVRGSDSDASMTAFTLIAMQESRTRCTETVNSLPSSIDKAVAYLERRLPTLTNPYAVAMTSYALANEDKLNKQILYKFAAKELTHWPVPGGYIFTLEATAYALLALVKAKAFDDAAPVVRWFNQQRTVGGGYGSTQATIMVYQAVGEYWVGAQQPEYNLNVDILLPGRAKPDRYNFNRDNFFATRTSNIKDINQDVQVEATGSGEATVTVVSLYYALPSTQQRDCPTFNLSVALQEEKSRGDKKMYKLRIDVL